MSNETNQTSALFTRQTHVSDGAHYSIFKINKEYGVGALLALFPDGEANDMNMVMFSTSGVHGSYITIEELEQGLKTNDPDFEGDFSLTVLVIQPRLVCMRYGTIDVKLEDIPFLKKLRASSNEFLQNSIGIN